MEATERDAMRRHLETSDDSDFAYMSPEEQEATITEQLAFDAEVALGLFAP